MSKLFLTILLALFLTVTSVANTWASTPLKGGCPGGFTLHAAHDHDEHHGHKHVGSDTDRNGDGWICVKPVSHKGNIHVHIDNNAAMP